MTSRTLAILAALLVLAPRLAFGHPGHGTTEPSGLRHYLTEPIHLVSLVISIAVAFVVIVALRRLRRAH